MAKKFSELKKKMSPAARAQSSALANELIVEARLAEVRRAREMTQTRLAMAMETTQAEISKIEQRSDCYISTLRSYIEAMNGELEIIARFPDGKAVKITQFSELATT